MEANTEDKSTTIRCTGNRNKKYYEDTNEKSESESNTYEFIDRDRNVLKRRNRAELK